MGTRVAKVALITRRPEPLGRAPTTKESPAMKLRINDLHMQLISRAILEPGEQLLGKVMGRSQPWYTSFLRFDCFMPYTLVLATDRRLILLKHQRGIFAFHYELTSVESIAWSEVEDLKAKGLIVKNKIRLRARTGAGLRTMVMNVPRGLAPLRANGTELKAVVAAFGSRGQNPALAGGYGAPALPSAAPGAYGPASQSYGAPGYAPPGYGPPSGH